VDKWCSGAGDSQHEAWALQYNQHLGKTLLVPVEQPKSLQQHDDVSKESFRDADASEEATPEYTGECRYMHDS